MKNIKINIKNLEKKFEQKIILKKINLKVFESESLAIIGESGSGKSVLTKCIIGLLRFENGKILYNDKLNIEKIKNNEMIKYTSKFGVLFQNAALFDSLNVRQNLSFEVKLTNFDEILNDVGLDNSILESYPSDLSVGVQKRIGLARAIISNPEVLIFDEPTTGLDILVADQINKLLRKLVIKKKLTTITITHDMKSVYEYADKVAFINKGKINWYGHTKEIEHQGTRLLKDFINGKH